STTVLQRRACHQRCADCGAHPQGRSGSTDFPGLQWRSPLMFHFRTWLRRVSGKLFRFRGATGRRPRRSNLPRLAEKVLLRLEQLETRLLPATYLVNSTADSGTGTLRDAINQVNAGDYDVIDFNISTGDSGYNSSTGSWTITPTS